MINNKLVSTVACILGLAVLPSVASAGLSDHTFAWTHGIGSAQLVLNGSTTYTATNRGWVDGLGTNNFGGANGGFLSQSSALLYTLFDVSGNPLTDSGLGIFNDLASGNAYGSISVDSSTNGSIVSITLNATAVAAIDAAYNSTGIFYIGGTVSPVPEPATYGMLLAGLGLLGFMVRRKNQAV